jgi:hypothetical protein
LGFASKDPLDDVINLLETQIQSRQQLADFSPLMALEIGLVPVRGVSFPLLQMDVYALVHFGMTVSQMLTDGD